MRTLHVLAVVVVTGFLMGGCSKGAEGGGSGDVSVPNELLGSYSGTEDSDHVLVVGPMGMKSEGIICSKNIAFESFDPAGENKWKFTGEYNGVLVKTGEDLNISVDGDDCFAEGIAGVFKKATAKTLTLPEDMIGLYRMVSSSSKECHGLSMTVSSKAIAFSGAEGCNDTATVKSLSVEGPLISIKHSGLTSSGWEMSITRDGGQMIVSAGIFSGTYAKGAPAPAAEPVAAPPAAPTLTELPDKLRGKYKKKDGTGKGASNKGKMTITKRKVMVTNCYNWEDYCNVTIDVAGVEEDDPLYTVSIRDNREQLGEMERAMKAHQGSKPFTISVNDNSIDISDHPYWSGTWTKQ